MNYQMRSIRSSLTCQSPSDYIQFFKIASDRPIVRSHCQIFPPIRQTIKKSGNMTLALVTLRSPAGCVAPPTACHGDTYRAAQSRCQA